MHSGKELWWKKVWSGCEKMKAFSTGERTAAIETYMFHARFIEEVWEETSFCAPNVTVGCIKDALEYKSAWLR